MPMSRPIAALLLTSLLVLPAGAQTPPPGRLRHEPLPPSKSSGPRTDRPVGGSGGLPEAIETAAGTIDQPKPAKTGDDTPTYEPRPPPRVAMDRRTGADSQLHYQMVFDPSIAPFKREVAFDAVTPEVTLFVTGQGLQRLPDRSEPRPGHELFWGHVRLRLQPGQRTPLPSVAPTSQLLQWQAVPSTPLEVWRDQAGNFSVTSSQAADVDLRFLMDAPSEYFAAPLGTQKRKDDPTTPRLDPTLQARAEKLWPALGVSPSMERGQVLRKLVEWFRGFQPGEPPARGSDPLGDLVLSQKGVCRHRALGFLVIAHSLGIPAHYVMNDAHAFAEAWAPRQDGTGAWQRIDLGGGADSLELHAAQGKHLHQPLHRDPFPRPPAYENAVGTVTVDGVPVRQAFAGARKVKGAEQLAGSGGFQPGTGSGGASQPGNGPGLTSASGPMATTGTEAEARRAWLRQRAEQLAAPLVAPRPGASQPPPGQQDTRKPSALKVQASALGWVGETLKVEGALTVPGGKVARQPVEIWLLDPANPKDGRLLGMAVTDGQGRFVAQVAVPGEVSPQAYDLVARYPGDGQQRPCDSGP